VDVPGGYCLHVINCFEDGDWLTMDVLLLDEPVYSQYQPLPDLFANVPLGRPARYRIDPAGRKLVDVETLPYTHSPDFPSIQPEFAGRAMDEFWMLGMSHAGKPGRKFFDELAHGSWSDHGVNDVYRAPEGSYFGGEPVFVANPAAPDEAVVITQIHTPAERRSQIAVFDARCVRGGPIASIQLRHPIHPGFHGSFAPHAYRQTKGVLPP
jgi:carotenoid cleavage dioxygenase-like enzyme